MNNRGPTKKQMIRTLEKLKKNPKMKERILGDAGITVMGGVLGGASAGSVAGLTGVTTIGGLTTAASWLGITAVAATPVGWVAGSAVIGAGAAYGISRLIRGAAYSEAKRKQLVRDIENRITDIERKEAASCVTESDKVDFMLSLLEPLRRNLISPEHVRKLMEGIYNGTIKLSDACRSMERIAKSKAGSERC